MLHSHAITHYCHYPYCQFYFKSIIVVVVIVYFIYIFGPRLQSLKFTTPWGANLPLYALFVMSILIMF